MEKRQTYSLDYLTTESVSVIIDSEITIEGVTYQLGRSRKAYSNSPIGRQQLQDEIPTEYYEAVMALWGDEPTVVDPENIN